MIIDNYLKKYKPLYRGHTPGHKGRLCDMDITEILEEFPSGRIEQAEQRTAEVYGVKAVRYLVNGSSIGIKAAVMALKEDFITDGYYHPAVTEAATLAGVKAYILDNTYNESEDMYELTTAEMIEKAIEESGIKNVLLQYPDYYGRTADVAEIAKVVKAHGGTLICDGAHGAHFAFRRDLFPALGADYSDICNMSAHKTLFAYTQTAYLAINNTDLLKGVDNALKLLGTTSPNYLLLSSLEWATEKGIETADRYGELYEFVESYKKEFPCLKNNDFTRLVLDAGENNGERAALIFRKKGVIPEKYNKRYVVFILTPFDSDNGLEILMNTTRKVLAELKQKV